MGLNAIVGSGPGTNQKVEQSPDKKGPHVAAQESGLYFLGSEESSQIFKELNDMIRGSVAWKNVL